MRLVVVVLMLAVAACASSTSSGSDVVLPTTGTSTSTTLPAVTPTPQTPAAPPDSTAVPPGVPGWTNVEDLPSSIPGAYVATSLVTGSRSLVSVCEPAVDRGTNAIWWSDNLRNWQEAALPDPSVCVDQIAASPFGYFAVGPGTIGLLRSVDGVSWAEDTAFSGEVFAPAHSVFPSPDGKSVTVLSLTPSVGESSVAHLFTTADGLTWTEEKRAAAELFDSSVLTQVEPGGDGLLAIGQSPGGEFVPTAAVFTSADGATWRRLTPSDTTFNDQVVMDIETLPEGGFLAVGGDFFRTGLMSSWISADGFDWSALPQPPNPAIDPSVSYETASDVTATDRGFLAAGTEYDARRDQADAAQSAFWESTDGETWTRLRFDGPVPITPFLLGASESVRLAAWPPRGTEERGDLQLFVQPK